MTDIVDVVPISDLRVKQREVLEKVQGGPVVLAKRSRPAAVLLSWERWRELVEELELLQDTVEAANARARLDAGEDIVMDAQDYIASRGERYRLRLSREATKELGRLQGRVWERVREALLGLRDDPRPPGCAKLRVSPYRVR